MHTEDQTFARSAGRRDAATTYGVKEAGFFGGLRAAGNFMNKIPGIGAISGGVMGAIQGGQQYGLKGAITHGALGAATGAMGVMGLPLQMGGEKVLQGMQRGPAGQPAFGS